MSRQYDEWREEIVGCLAHVEAFIDFADEEDDVNEAVYTAVIPRSVTKVPPCRPRMHRRCLLLTLAGDAGALAELRHWRHGLQPSFRARGARWSETVSSMSTVALQHALPHAVVDCA